MLFALSLTACPLAEEAPSSCCSGMSMVASSLTGMVFFALVLYLALKLLRRRKKGKPARRERTEIDRWLDDALARELVRKVGIDREVVDRALEGSPDPEAVSSMEAAVRSMQVKYARTPDGSVEARLDICFEDGTNASASRVFSMDKAPAGIRDEFTRTGGAFVFRAFDFPWSATERGWAD
jgi:hypothetical protein